MKKTYQENRKEILLKAAKYISDEISNPNYTAQQIKVKIEYMVGYWVDYINPYRKVTKTWIHRNMADYISIEALKVYNKLPNKRPNIGHYITGKKHGIFLEHMTPNKVIRKMIHESDFSESEIFLILNEYFWTCIVTTEENKLINENKQTSSGTFRDRYSEIEYGKFTDGKKAW